MRILIISQVFWPDTASTAQHLYDLAETLVKQGHEVKVISSRNDYENTSKKYPKYEVFNKIKIQRLNNTSFGKLYKLGRLLDFFTFCSLLLPRLFFLKKTEADIIIGMTSPPLVSFLIAVAANVKKIRFCYWVMDLQPELSIATGFIHRGSVAARALQSIGDYTIKSASIIIVLDKYMKSYVMSRGAEEEKVHISEVWSAVENVYEGSRDCNSFRIENNFGNKIVIMYSGNHAAVHPLDTLLEAAYLLRFDERFLFVFIGGGVRKKDVSEFKEKYSLENIMQLPYQPRQNIHLSLGSADLQVVVMGDQLTGYTHPNKIYGSMFLKKPVLYIGPTIDNHITDILGNLKGNIIVSHGESRNIVENLNSFALLSAEQIEKIGEDNFHFIQRNFNPEKLKAKMVNFITVKH